MAGSIGWSRRSESQIVIHSLDSLYSPYQPWTVTVDWSVIGQERGKLCTRVSYWCQVELLRSNLKCFNV